MCRTIPALGLLALTLLVGCRPPVTTNVTAFAQPEAAARKRFVLQGPDPRYPGGDPRWPVFAQILTKGLVARGFIPDAMAPELLIRVTYRVGDTQTYTSTTVTAAPTDANGTPIGTPSETTISSDSSMRTLRIEALDPASVAAGKAVILWSTHGSSRGDDDDLAKVLPAMVAAMENFFATSVPVRVRVDIKKGDPEADRLAQP